VAEKPVRNRSSEGVVAIRHPRTDFPQMGWLSKATITFYEPNSGFGWFSETQSYLPNQNRNGYKTRQRAIRPFYQTEPQQGWLNKPVNPNLYEANTGTAWLAQTATWITPKHPARDLDRWDQDDTNFDVINFSQAFNPALQDWHIETVQTRKRKWWTSDPQQFDWLYQNVLVDPSVFLWTIPDVRTRARNAAIPRGSEPQDTSWAFPNLPAVFDPAIQNWLQQTDRTAPGLRYRRDTNTDVSWIFQNLTAVFDPATQTWMLDTTRTGTRKWWAGDQPQFDWLYQNVLFDPFLYRGSHPADRMAPNLLVRDWQRFRTDPDLAWIFTNLTLVFDPATQSWTLDWPRMGIRKTWNHIPTPDAWLVPSVIFDASLFPATTLSSHRQWVKAIGRWQPDVDNAWLYYSAVNKIWTISGQTQTCSGAVLGSCTVLLFRTSDNVIIGTTTSDGAGNYSFTVSDGTTAYFLVAYYANAPDVTGATLNTIFGS